MSTHPARSADTPRSVEQLQFDLWREMPDWRKLQLFGDLCASARLLAEAGMRERFPEADNREIRLRVAATWLDRETLIQAYGWDPVEHDADS